MAPKYDCVFFTRDKLSFFGLTGFLRLSTTCFLVLISFLTVSYTCVEFCIIERRINFNFRPSFLNSVLLFKVYYNLRLIIENQDFGGSSQVFQSLFVAIQGCLRYCVVFNLFLGDLVIYQTTSFAPYLSNKI